VTGFKGEVFSLLRENKEGSGKARER